MLQKKEKKNDLDEQIIHLLITPPVVTKDLHHHYVNIIKKRQELKLEQQNKLLSAHDSHNDTDNTNNNDIDNDNSNKSQTNNNNSSNKSYNDNDNDNDFIKDGPQLVLYPPVKKQSTEGKVIPLILSSATNLIISFTMTTYPDTDIYPLLIHSNLIHVFDKYGFQTQVKRSTNWAKIKLAIDSNLCPGRHSYRISVEPDYVVIIASVSGV